MNEASMKIMLRQMDAPLVMTLTDVISQDDILQRKLSSSNNSQAVLSRTVWIKTSFFGKTLDLPELSLCGKAVVERTHDGQTPFYFQDTRY